jgi:hypothetical protein
MADLNGKIDPISHHRLTRHILPPIVEMLQEMDSYRIAHRALRPDNIFFDADNDALKVGECFSVPAGLSQPAAFEPIERAMCHPHGRGQGEAADDLFALGVTTLYLVLGQNPVAGIDDATLLTRRRQLGSYTAIVGKRRVPAELIQMLRSLLRDEPDERWNAEDLLGWLVNGRGSAAPGAAKIECSRAYEFGERKFKTAQTLAYGLAADWPAALEEVRAGRVEKWAHKSLKDKRCQVALARCRVSGANGPRTVTDDLLLARTLIALDPRGPVRYRDITVMPDGIGPLMASVLDDGTRLKQLVELLTGRLPTFRLEQNDRPTYGMLTTDESQAAVLPLLGQQAAGFGVERALYELNPGLACRSPLVADASPSDTTQLLKALDARVGRGESVFDRHVAAFAATRVSGSVDRDLNDIALARAAGDRLLAQLQLFAYVQGKSDADILRGLCRHFIDMSPAILETYRNIPLRAKLARAARAAAETGDLTRIVKVLANEKSRRWDTNGFNAARRQYRNDESEAAALQASYATIPERSRNTGRQIGAMAAGAMSLVTTVVVLLTRMS